MRRLPSGVAISRMLGDTLSTVDIDSEHIVPARLGAVRALSRLRVIFAGEAHQKFKTLLKE